MKRRSEIPNTISSRSQSVPATPLPHSRPSASPSMEPGGEENLKLGVEEEKPKSPTTFREVKSEPLKSFRESNLKYLERLKMYHSRQILDDLLRGAELFENAVNALVNNRLLFKEFGDIKNEQLRFLKSQMDLLKGKKVSSGSLSKEVLLTKEYFIENVLLETSTYKLCGVQHREMSKMRLTAKVFRDNKDEEKFFKTVEDCAVVGVHRNLASLMGISKHIDDPTKNVYLFERIDCVLSEVIQTRIEKGVESFPEVRQLLNILLGILEGVKYGNTRNSNKKHNRHNFVSIRPCNVGVVQDATGSPHAKLLYSYHLNSDDPGGELLAPENVNEQPEKRTSHAHTQEIFSVGVLLSECLLCYLPDGQLRKFLGQRTQILESLQIDPSSIVRREQKEKHVRTMERFLELLSDDCVPAFLRKFAKSTISMDVGKRKAMNIPGMIDSLREFALYSERGLRMFKFSEWFQFPLVLDHSLHRSGGYDYADIRIHFTGAMNLECGERFRSLYANLERKYSEMLSEGKIYNSTIVRPYEVHHVREDDLQGREVLVLKADRTTYIHSKIMLDIFKTLREEEKEKVRGRIVSQSKLPVFICSLGVHCGLITSDQKVLFCRRSRKVHFSRGKYTCGAVETVDMKDVKGDKVDVFHACHRALGEELGITLQENEIYSLLNVTGLMCKKKPLQMGFVGYVKLAKSSFDFRSSSELQSFHSFSKGPDSYEHKEWMFVDFNIKACVRFLRKNKEYMTQSGLCCILFMLKSEFGADDVDRAVFRACSTILN